LLEKRGVSGAATLAMLEALEAVVRPLDGELYQTLEKAALARIGEQESITALWLRIRLRT
jgi:hypothetical protein